MTRCNQLSPLAQVALIATTTLSLSVASGCHATETSVGTDTAQANVKDVQAKVDALKKKTLEDLVFVEGGTFQMGDFGPIHGEEGLQYSTNADDNVLHEVTLDSFSVLAHKVTYQDFDVYTDATGKDRIAQDPMDLKYRNIPDVPAGVNWHDARSYCQWVGTQINSPMDLLTEAQWEYAARNRGEMLIFATDNGKIDDGRNVRSFDQKQEFKSKHHVVYMPALPVGKLPPTPLGLYDMVGNGYEWVLDSYQPEYSASPQKNPVVTQGEEKVMRGYEAVGGGTLQLVAMTFTRESEPPREVPELDPDGHPYTDNAHAGDTFRCAVNSTTEVSH